MIKYNPKCDVTSTLDVTGWTLQRWSSTSAQNALHQSASRYWELLGNGQSLKTTLPHLSNKHQVLFNGVVHWNFQRSRQFLVKTMFNWSVSYVINQRLWLRSFVDKPKRSGDKERQFLNPAPLSAFHNSPTRSREQRHQDTFHETLADVIIIQLRWQQVLG